MTPKLVIDNHGQLAVPHTAFTESIKRDMEKFPELFGDYIWCAETERSIKVTHDDDGNRLPQALGGHNRYGEPFSCDWEDGKFNRAELAVALFDARETGLMVDVPEVVLPDGEVFVIDRDYGQDDL
tara:strand:+ start:101 stop:478 length:378 start_codon:yes stop_codon:yes gene_type:complete